MLRLFSVCILCVSLSELLLGVGAPRSVSFSVSIYMYAMYVVVHLQYYPMSYHKHSIKVIGYYIEGWMS